MIVHMAKVRIAGPRALLDRVLVLLQDVGALHVTKPPARTGLSAEAGEARGAGEAGERERRHLRLILADVEAAQQLLGEGRGPATPARAPASLPASARWAKKVRRRLEALAKKIGALHDEHALLLRYREFFSVFESLLGRQLAWPDGRAFYVVLRAGASGAETELRKSLEDAVGKELEMLARPLASGETAVLLLVSAAAAPKVALLLSESRVQELPAPSGIGETDLLRALPTIKKRLAAIPAELDALEGERKKAITAQRVELEGLGAWLHDRLLILDARGQVLEGQHLFVLEGWLPRPELTPLSERIAREIGNEVLVELVGTEPWSRVDAPVALTNPRLFRPFELVTRMVPLPRYGTIDPTPFVAVFFPAFFGLMVGDVGHGVLMVALALLLRWKSKEGSTLRAVAEVLGACALSTMIFGVLFGEIFGSLGHDWLGMRPLAFNREEAILPFLGLSVALGAVHIVLGLALAAVGAWRQGHRREAMGRGVALIMVALTVLSLLAAFEVLPSALFTPAVVALLVAFPALVVLEGIVAVIELLSTFGHILSYARIMAIGTASLMLAVVANKMVGAMGSVLIGVVFALLFHSVNFALALFSPTIHALRLHYVEFFGKFYSPGGTAYHPLAHWRAREDRLATAHEGG